MKLGVCLRIACCVALGLLAHRTWADELAPPGKPGSDWPCFLGPTGDSKSNETGILTRWPATGPPIVWTLPVGTGYCMPVVAEGRLYQFDRVRDSARLRCLDRATGKLHWNFTYPSDFEDLYGYDNGPRASPLVNDKRVYIFGAEGMLHCLNAEDGKLIWVCDTAAEFGVVQNFFGVGSSPIVSGDLLLVAVGGSPAESRRAPPGRLDVVTSNGSGVVAFDKTTGAVRYKTGDELASYASPVLATIDDRPWCLLFARGGLLGFEPSQGKIGFHFPYRASLLESVNAANPVVVGNRVLISECYGPGGTLLKIGGDRPEVVWTDAERRREKSLQTHWNTPVVHEGYVYASSGRHTEDAELRCIEWETGDVKWSVPDLTRASLLYADEHFVCLSEEGTLRLLRANPLRYEQVAEVVLEQDAMGPNPFGFRPPRLLRYPAWAAPILSHGLLYVRGADHLVCLELIPGNQ